MKRMRDFWREEGGFSLVELAIVLIVIGLIIGGILKGQDLIESARLKSALSQVNEFRLATATFMDKYDAMPGDFDKASSQIEAGLQNGQNNGVVDGPGLSAGAGNQHEALSFWTHLSAARLLPSPGQVVDGTARFGAGAPAAKIGGGFTIRHDPFPDMPGHWFVLGKENGAEGNGPLLTPLQALGLDKKGDDGDPKRGRIQARDGAGVAAGDCVRSDGTYNTTNTRAACVLYFQL